MRKTMTQYSEDDFIAFMNSNRGLKDDEPIEWSLLRSGWTTANSGKPFTKSDMNKPARYGP